MEVAVVARRDILDQILKIDEKIIRFAGIVDTNQNTLTSKSQKNKESLVTQREEEELAMDMQNIRKTHDKFNDQLGEVTFIHITRKKLHQFVCYLDNLIIYVTYDPIADSQVLLAVSEKIEQTIKNYFYKL